MRRGTSHRWKTKVNSKTYQSQSGHTSKANKKEADYNRRNIKKVELFFGVTDSERKSSKLPTEQLQSLNKKTKKN